MPAEIAKNTEDAIGIIHSSPKKFVLMRFTRKHLIIMGF